MVSFLHSCTKEQIENDFLFPSNPNQVNIDRAKTWFEKTVLQNSTKRTSLDGNGYLYFDWSNASLITAPDGKRGIITPIFDTKKLLLKEDDWGKVKQQAYKFRKLPNAVKILYIYVDKKGQEEYRLLNYIPNSDTKPNGKFSGYVGVVLQHGKLCPNI